MNNCRGELCSPTTQNVGRDALGTPHSKTKGRLFVLSGPSGVGKGTVWQEVLELVPNIKVSVSATTRKPRSGDVEGVNYFFKSPEQFAEMIERGELLEWAVYNGNHYGTPIWAVEDMLASGTDVILEIDTQGALQVKMKMPEAILIFIAPPSFDALLERLKGRATESDEEIARRVAAAEAEMAVKGEYDHVVVNDDLQTAVREVEAIFNPTL